MAIICPTVTAYDKHEYREQIERIEQFVSRVHIDLMDGQFAPMISPGLDSVWWPEQLTADIHLMYQDVTASLPRLIELRPNMVIVHAEVHSQNDLPLLAAKLREAGIKTGLALLPETTVESVRYLLPHMQHALVFSGKLGHHGGVADLSLLKKVKQIRLEHRWLEIGWDGGINETNARQLVEGGVEVLNVGSYIQKTAQPKAHYEKLQSLLQS